MSLVSPRLCDLRNTDVVLYTVKTGSGVRPPTARWGIMYLTRRNMSEDDTTSPDDRSVQHSSDAISGAGESPADPHGSNNARNERPDGTTSRPTDGHSPAAGALSRIDFFPLPDVLVQDMLEVITKTNSSLHINEEEGEVSSLLLGSVLPSVPDEVKRCETLLSQAKQLSHQTAARVAPLSQCRSRAVGLMLEPEVVERFPDLRSRTNVGEGFVRLLEPGDSMTMRPRLMWRLADGLSWQEFGTLYSVLVADESAYIVRSNSGTQTSPATQTGPEIQTDPEAQTSPETRTDGTSPPGP